VESGKLRIRSGCFRLLLEHLSLWVIGFIAICSGVALSIWYVLATDASWIGKVIVGLMSGVALSCVFYATRFSTFGFILISAVALYVDLYKAYLES
jgi:hypothetical protein